MRKHSYFGGNSKEFDEHHCGRLDAGINVWVYAANKVQKAINERTSLKAIDEEQMTDQ